MSAPLSPRGGSKKTEAGKDSSSTKKNDTQEKSAAELAVSPRTEGKKDDKNKHLTKQIPSLDLQQQLPDQYKKKSSVNSSGKESPSSEGDPGSPELAPKNSARPTAKGPTPATGRGTATPKTLAAAPDPLKHHRFLKKQFGHPTWCIFAEKFIWGLDKGGYECRDCQLAISRKCIAEAKNTVCGDLAKSLGSTNKESATATYTKTKVFTVHLPQGNKKSFLLNPMQPLVKELEKICFARDIKMEEYVAMDTNGNPVPLNTLLGKIQGSEVTFTQKDPTMSKKRLLPPTFEEVYAQMGLKDSVEQDKQKSLGGFGKPMKGLAGLLGTKERKGASRSSNYKKKDSVTSSTNDTSVQDEAMLSPHVEEVKAKLPVTQRYTIGKELGSGAFSVVYEATENTTGETVAIKILDRYDDDPEQAAKFKHEIDMISGLKHDNVVQFIELDEDEEHYYVVMELVKGGELFDQIIDRGGYPSEEAADLIAQILKALEYMHGEKTAHRDIKPENILFKDEKHDVIKIADFGESKKFDEGKPLTTYCGTPDYMAPEIIKGMPYGPAVDMWAMGVIAYVTIAGFPPFDGENDVEVFASIMGVRYDFPSPEWDDVDQDAKDFIAAILKENPEDRLTASQALKHPWIVKNVPEKHRVNAVKEVFVVPSTPKGKPNDDETSQNGEQDKSKDKSNDRKGAERKGSRHGIKVSVTSADEVTELGHLDTSDLNAGQKVLDAILSTQNLARTSLVYMGELVTMEAIVRSIMGDKVEGLILPIYWKRLIDVRKVMAAEKSKKKKK